MFSLNQIKPSKNYYLWPKVQLFFFLFILNKTNKLSKKVMELKILNKLRKKNILNDFSRFVDMKFLI